MRKGSVRHVGAPPTQENKFLIWPRKMWGKCGGFSSIGPSAEENWEGLGYGNAEGDFWRAFPGSFKRGVERSKSLFSLPPRSVLLTLSVKENTDKIFFNFLRLWGEGSGGDGDWNISPNTDICPSSYLICWSVHSPCLGSAQLLRKFLSNPINF